MRKRKAEKANKKSHQHKKALTERSLEMEKITGIENGLPGITETKNTEIESENEKKRFLLNPLSSIYYCINWLII